MCVYRFSLGAALCTAVLTLMVVSISLGAGPDKPAGASAAPADQGDPPFFAGGGGDERRPPQMRPMDPPGGGGGPMPPFDGPGGPSGPDGPGRGHRPPMGQPPYGDPRGGGPGERGPYGPGDAPPPRWPHGDARSMEANDPEMFKVLKEDMDLDRKSRELAVQYRQAPSAQRDAIKKLLEQVVDQHFEVRQQRHALELKRLEQEIKNLHERMDRRVKARKEIVAKRVSELLGVEDDLHF